MDAKYDITSELWELSNRGLDGIVETIKNILEVSPANTMYIDLARGAIVVTRDSESIVASDMSSSLHGMLANVDIVEPELKAASPERKLLEIFFHASKGGLIPSHVLCGSLERFASWMSMKSIESLVRAIPVPVSQDSTGNVPEDKVIIYSGPVRGCPAYYVERAVMLVLD